MKAKRSDLADEIMQDREASNILYKAIFKSKGSDKAFTIKTKLGNYTIQKSK